MLVAETFLPNIVKENNKYLVSTDGGEHSIHKPVDFQR